VLTHVPPNNLRSTIAQQFERFRENIVEMPHHHFDLWMYSKMKKVPTELVRLGLL